MRNHSGLAVAAIVMLSVMGAAAQTNDSKPRIDTSGVNAQPAYPASALTAKERGAVLMDVSVAEDGKVDRIKLVKTSGFNDLDGAAIVAVMNWRFVPAVSGGHNVAGQTLVQLGFEPPNDAADTKDGSHPQAPLQAGDDEFPVTDTLSAKRNFYQETTTSIPCPYGFFRVDFEIGHAIGPITSTYAPSMWVTVKDASSRQAQLAIIGIEHTLREGLTMRTADKSGVLSQERYSYLADWGRPITGSIYWDADGNISAEVGGMETHRVHLNSVPIELQYGVSSISGTFSRPELVCTPPTSAMP